MKLPLAASLAFFFLPACLEHEEVLTIGPDGSCTVHLEVKGQPQDFADGYPLPSGAEWTVARAELPEYLDWMRSGLDSAALRARLAAVEDKEIAFEFDARFASPRDLPHSLAPASDPYRAAYAVRSADLRIERHGSRTVYFFERRLGAREFARFDAWSRMKRDLPEDLVKRLEQAPEGELPLDDGERQELASAATAAMRAAASAHVEDALLAVYTLGNAELPLAAHAAIEERVRAALERVVAEERLRAILDLLVRGSMERQMARSSATEEAGRRLTALEEETRATLRSTTHEALVASGLAKELCNAVRAQLESSLTALDQTNDLADEAFRFVVHLPGELVGGNHHKLDDSGACWEIRGDELQDREIVLRAVSVVE